MTIKNLYYIYSYEIDFANVGNVLILTGPNGFGKTTILQMINHLCSLRLWYFYSLPFDKVEISFEDEYSLSINKLNIDENNYGDVNFTLLNNTENIYESFELREEFVVSMARHRAPFTEKFDANRLDEYLETYSNEESIEFFERKMPKIVDFLRTQKCAMIEEQRLVIKNVSRSSYVYSRTVEDIEKKISIFYAEAQKTYNFASLKIDGSFVKRLSDKEPTKIVKHIKGEHIYKKV